MDTKALTVTYIDHSGFMVESESAILLFDYHKGNLYRKVDKPLYIFASHRHSDHFSREIFRWGESVGGAQYILSDDIDPAPVGVDAERIHFIGADESLILEDIKIRTLGSTDEGVAFLVSVDGKTIFHAGDLNWWLWGEEDTPQEAREMSDAFLKEAEKLRGVSIDAAFLPLDPRQPEDQYWLGLDHYARTADIKNIFPMHMWGQHDIIGRFKALDCTAPYRDRITGIASEDEKYEI